MAAHCARGPEDGDQQPVGISLGIEFGRWLAVQWDDEDDPDFVKVDCVTQW